MTSPADSTQASSVIDCCGDYERFLSHKIRKTLAHGFAPIGELNPKAFDWQKLIIERCVRQGRHAIFEDCGLGKTLQSLEWCRQVCLHICPLQLDTINRLLRLYTNPGDLVYSPFMGIGSEGYCAVKMGRKFIGSELKKSYFDTACTYLDQAEEEKRTLFSLHA